jgi:hypothetical protein
MARHRIEKEKSLEIELLIRKFKYEMLNEQKKFKTIVQFICFGNFDKKKLS